MGSIITSALKILSIASLKNILSKAEAPNLQGKVRCLIFDCCQVNTNVEEVDKPEDEENLFIFYTVPICQQSFVVDAAGLSVATSELIKMLDQDRPRSIKKFFIELKQKIPKAVETLCNAIDCGDVFNPTITVPVNFFQDMISSSKLLIYFVTICSLVLDKLLWVQGTYNVAWVYLGGREGGIRPPLPPCQSCPPLKLLNYFVFYSAAAPLFL